MSSFGTTMGFEPTAFVPEQSPVDRTPELILNEVVPVINDEAEQIENASDQLGELIDDMTQVASEYDHIGHINPENTLALQIATESLKGQIRTISHRHKLPLTYVLNNISTESIQSLGIEALGSLGDMIGDVWQTIKEVLVGIWDKLKDFWKKNFAEMTLVHKAILRVEESIKSRKGEIVHSEILEANSKFNRMFSPDEKITPELITRLLTRQDETSKVAGKFVDEAFDSMKQASNTDVTDASKMDEFFMSVIDTVKKISGSEDSAVILGDEDKPLASFTTAKIEFSYGEDTQKKSIKIRFVKDKTTAAEEGRQIVFGDRASLERLVAGMKKLYVVTEAIGKNSEKQDREFRRLFETVTRKVTSDAKGSSEELNEVNNNAKFISELYKQYGVAIPKVNTFMTRINLDLIKAVVAYINDSLKLFKVSGS